MVLTALLVWVTDRFVYHAPASGKNLFNKDL